MKAKGKKFVSLFLVFSLLALLSNLIAKERRGVDLVITKKDGQQVEGELIAVKKNSLLLLDYESRADASIDIKDIKVIKIVKKSKSWEGFRGGGLAGALIGIILCSGYKDQELKGYVAISGLFALAGGLLGGLIGASSGGVETIQIEGKSDVEIKEVLEKLRKKARIPDYK